MNITNKTTVQDAILILKDIDFLDRMNEAFQKVDIPEMTYGQRIDLSEIRTWYDLLFLPQRILNGLSDSSIMLMPFYSAFNFGMSVVKELERMAKRDKETFKYNPTSEEIRAGYHNLDFGVFGIVDRIAQRMHIANHDDVFDIPEKRVYAMLHIDYKNAMYQRSLNELSKKKSK